MSFRNDIFPDYKANRDEPPEDLVPQFAMVREATKALNLPCVEMEHAERPLTPGRWSTATEEAIGLFMKGR